jgi:hypothetical protein
MRKPEGQSESPASPSEVNTQVILEDLQQEFRDAFPGARVRIETIEFIIKNPDFDSGTMQFSELRLADGLDQPIPRGATRIPVLRLVFDRSTSYRPRLSPFPLRITSLDEDSVFIGKDPAHPVIWLGTLKREGDRIQQATECVWIQDNPQETQELIVTSLRNFLTQSPPEIPES